MEKIESPLDSKRSREMKKIQEEGNLCSNEVDEQRWQAVCDRTKYGRASLSSQSAQQGCTADPIVLPGERIGKMFLFTRLHLKLN